MRMDRPQNIKIFKNKKGIFKESFRGGTPRCACGGAW